MIYFGEAGQVPMWSVHVHFRRGEVTCKFQASIFTVFNDISEFDNVYNSDLKNSAVHSTDKFQFERRI